MLQPMLDMIEEASAEAGLEALLDRLPDAFDKMDASSVERLANDTYVQADLIGRTAAEPLRRQP